MVTDVGHGDDGGDEEYVVHGVGVLVMPQSGTEWRLPGSAWPPPEVLPQQTIKQIHLKGNVPSPRTRTALILPIEMS